MGPDKHIVNLAKTAMTKHSFTEDYLDDEQFHTIINHLEDKKKDAVAMEEYMKAAKLRDWIQCVGDMMLGYERPDAMNIVYSVCCDAGEVVDTYETDQEWRVVYKFGGCFYQFTVDWMDYRSAKNKIRKG